MRSVAPRFFAFFLILAGTGLAPQSSHAATAVPQKVVIADQFGPGHLVTVVMKKRNLLDRRFPDTEFDWRVVTSGAVMRDGILSNQIHVGLSAPPPFLVGLDKGVKWKILVAAATYDQWLVTTDPNINSLKDFKSGGRKQIGVVGLDSFPAIVLKKGAMRNFGDAKALDSHFVVMPPPHSIQAVVTGQIAGALVPPVHSVRALDLGARVVLRGNDVLSGPVTSNFYVMSESFYERYPKFAQAFYEAAGEAIQFIKDNPAEAYKMLSEDEGNKTSPEKYRDLFERSAIVFDTIPVRVLEVGQFMKDIGMIKQLPGSMREMSFPPLDGKGN